MRKVHIAIYAIVMIFGYWFEYKVIEGNMPFWLFILINLVVGHHWLHRDDYNKELVEAQKNVKPVVWWWLFVMCSSITGIVCNLVNKNWILLVIFLVLTIISIVVLCQHFDVPENMEQGETEQ